MKKSIKGKQRNNRRKSIGGGISRMFGKHSKKSTLTKKLILGKISVNTRNSEIDLIDTYKKFTKFKNKYLATYQEHRENLKVFDQKLGEGASFVKFFDEIIMPNDILSGDPIDEKNPLLINFYFIYNDSTIKNLKIEHIKQQIRYTYYKNFDKSQMKLLKDMSIKFTSPTSVNIEFIGKNNKQYFRDCPVDKFILDQEKIMAIIPEITENIKTNKSEYISEPAKFAIKKKAEDDAKLATEAEEAKKKEDDAKAALAAAEQAKFRPRGIPAPAPVPAGADYQPRADLIASAVAKPQNATIPIPSPPLPKINLMAEAPSNSSMISGLEDFLKNPDMPATPAPTPSSASNSTNKKS